MGTGSDRYDPWFGQLGRATAPINLDLQTGPGGPCGQTACPYSGANSPSPNCAFEITRAATAPGERVEGRLAEPCTLFYSTADPVGPTLLELEFGATVQAFTQNGTSPGAPPPFQCPL